MDLKVVVGVERSLQGSRLRNAVLPPTIEEMHESGTGRGVLMEVNHEEEHQIVEQR